jgi:signal transduction histidine kinase
VSEATYRAVLVDDNDEIRALNRTVLEELGPFEIVGEATNGNEGLEVVRDTEPDLVVLDLAMPHSDGLEALEQLEEDLPDTPVAVLSGFSRDVVEDPVIDSAASMYLEKGMNSHELVEKLTSLVEREQAPAGGLNGRGKATDADELGFGAMAAHELRDQIARIQQRLGLARHRLEADPDAAREAIDRGIASLDRVVDIVEGLEQLERADETRAQARFNLRAALERAIRSLPADLSADADIRYPRSNPVVLGDRELVELALANLTENGIRFAEAAPVVAVTAEPDGDRLRVFVDDEGPGIDPDAVEDAFEPFWARGEAAGSGIGLALARRVVEAHDGEISIEHREEGTRVAFTLPTPS